MADLESKQEDANQKFDLRTGEHNNEVKRLNREISFANSDVSRTTQFLQNVLYPQRQSIEANIDNLVRLIDQTRRFLNEAALQREAEHNTFLQKVSDIDGAVEAIQEAFGLLEQLQDSASPSLVQVNTVRSHLQKLHQII